MPESTTRTTTTSPSRAASTRTRPPGSVYHAAFERRFVRICARRTGSPCRKTGACGRATSSAWRRLSRSGRAASSALSTTDARETRSGLRPTFPCEIREMSSRSSMRRTRWVTCRSITFGPPRVGLRSSSPSPRRARISVACPIGARGFRSSCASVARNSFFLRSTSRSFCSARRRSATSAASAAFIVSRLAERSSTRSWSSSRACRSTTSWRRASTA